MSARRGRTEKVSEKESHRSFQASDWETKFPPVLSVEQAAELAHVPTATIYDWSSRGLLQGCAHRFGKRLRIFRDRFVGMLFGQSEF